MSEPDLPRSPEEFIDRAGWRFASTMAHIPHEYTVRGKETSGVPPPPVAWHDWFVDYIKANGYLAKWGRSSYTYLDVGGWKYWVIHPVINRERLPDS